MQPSNSERGFSLIDVCVTLSVAVVLLYALHSGTQTAMRARRTVESEYQLHLVAQEFLSRIRRIPYGNAGDPPPSSSQLNELFDDDEDVGTITLRQLIVAPDEDGYSFLMTSHEVSGTWRVRVTADLNGDGDVADEREGRADLVRAEIYYKDRPMLETLRAANPSLTTLDSAASYISGGVPQPPSKTSGSMSPPAPEQEPAQPVDDPATPPATPELGSDG